ncbi:hypothetical protein E0J20_09355 [Rhizobium leguminosarum bv. viciae]|nr:hypothetical protein E0J20_09355 [Rhizobium leguminosarum bv. viciae]
MSDWYQRAKENERKAERERRRALPVKEKVKEGWGTVQKVLIAVFFAIVAYAFIFGPMVGPGTP